MTRNLRFSSYALFVLCSQCPLSAVADSPDTECKLRGVTTLERLTEIESSEVLAQATQQQLCWRHLEAELDLVEFLNVSTIPQTLKQNWPALIERGGSISGTVFWYRDTDLERVDIRYSDVHPYANIALSGRYLSRIVVAASDKTTTIFPDSKQVLLTWPMGLTMVPAPADWFLPGTREDFEQLRARGARFEVYRSVTDFIIRYWRPVSKDEEVRVDVRVDPAQRYAVTEWQSSDLRKHVSIEYQEDETGLAPRSADCRTESGWQGLISVRAWQARAPGREVFQPEYPAGGLLSDATIKDKDPDIYSIEPGGILKPVNEVFRPVGKSSTSSQVGVITGVAVLFIGVLFFRTYWSIPRGH